MLHALSAIRVFSAVLALVSYQLLFLSDRPLSFACVLLAICCAGAVAVGTMRSSEIDPISADFFSWDSVMELIANATSMARLCFI